MSDSARTAAMSLSSLATLESFFDEHNEGRALLISHNQLILLGILDIVKSVAIFETKSVDHESEESHLNYKLLLRRDSIHIEVNIVLI